MFDDLAQGAGQRRERADPDIGEQLSLHRRAEPRIVVEQAVHVLQVRAADVGVREPGEPTQTAGAEIVGERCRDVDRRGALDQFGDDPNAAIVRQRRGVPGLHVAAVDGGAVRRPHLERSVGGGGEVDQPGVEGRQQAQIGMAEEVSDRGGGRTDGGHRASGSDGDENTVGGEWHGDRPYSGSAKA